MVFVEKLVIKKNLHFYNNKTMINFYQGRLFVFVYTFFFMFL